MTPPLAIGIVCYPSLGGSGVVASELALGLARRGHRIHLIASSRPSRELPPCAGETFHEVRVPPYPVFEHAPYTLAVAATIAEVARTHGLDLVQVHYAVPHAASALLARQVLEAGGARAPALVASLHGTDVTRVGSDPAYRPVTAHAVAAADGITVPSDFLRREARRCLGIPESQPIDVLPNFVDTEHYAPAPASDPARLAGLFAAPEAPGTAYLFHVSNFREVKRVPELMEVLARVRRERPARLVLVGDGPTRGAAVERADALGVSDAVAFLGRRAEFVEYLQHADAFVLPSETESFGVAALEAQSAGVPVFAFRVGGIPEVIVDGTTGCLVEPHDPERLAVALIEVLGDPARRAAMGRAARAHAVAHFAEPAAFDRHEAFFRRVVERRRSRDTR
jgi:N-acetyl-alpha-D-glucosaminyl L-malate synthase BshA